MSNTLLVDIQQPSVLVPEPFVSPFIGISEPRVTPYKHWDADETDRSHIFCYFRVLELWGLTRHSEERTMIRRGPSGFRGDGVSCRTNRQDRVRSPEGASSSCNARGRGKPVRNLRHQAALTSTRLLAAKHHAGGCCFCDYSFLLIGYGALHVPDCAAPLHDRSFRSELGL